MHNQVVLVNRHGEMIAVKDKVQAHIDGDLHLAFSLQLVRPAGDSYELLLQQRASDKYHSADLWANTCCSHPFLDEALEVAAKRRVKEELGIITHTELQDIGDFIYKARLDNDLFEHELDHILLGFDDPSGFKANPQEVQQTQWLSLAQIDAALSTRPETFCVWFPTVYQHVKSFLSTLTPAD